MNISVIGLGKLGLCTASYFASKGHHVIGVEKNANFVSQLQARQCPIQETGLENLLEKSWSNLEVTMDQHDGVMRSDVSLIIVPTPSRPDGKFSNEYIERVLRDIGPIIKKKNRFHIVDVVSTVMPGSCDNIFKPLLEQLIGQECGKGFGLVYNPEFIALGSVITNFARPDMVLIGASDEKSGLIVRELYERSCENEPHMAVMTLLNAEITKLSLNCFVTSKISFANELSNICERIPGADVDQITDALGADTRIGRKYLTGGLGFGGTCFPRDNLAFQAFTKEIGYHANLSRATVTVNHSVVEKLYEYIMSNVPRGGKVALFGLAYKQDTHIIEESQSITLSTMLIKSGFKVNVHDPQALEEAKSVLGYAVDYFDDPYRCAEGTDAVILLTHWPQFKQLDWERIERNVHDNALLIDSWRNLKQRKFTRFNYIGLGLGVLRIKDMMNQFALKGKLPTLTKEIYEVTGSE